VPQILFLAGLARSGTTALAQLFDAHPRVAVGMERFKRAGQLPGSTPLGPQHFTRERFFDFSDGLTNVTPDASPRWRSLYDGLEAKWDGATYVGDKLTHVRLGRLQEVFPEARFVCIVRDVRSVAASWQKRAANTADVHWAAELGARAAVADWNRSLQRTARAKRLHPDRVVIVEYDELYGDPEGATAHRVLDWLGLDRDPAFTSTFTATHRRYVEAIATKARVLAEEDEAYVVEHAKLDLWERVRRRTL
jgi:hypothetical protein